MSTAFAFAVLNLLGPLLKFSGIILLKTFFVDLSILSVMVLSTFEFCLTKFLYIVSPISLASFKHMQQQNPRLHNFQTNVLLSNILLNNLKNSLHKGLFSFFFVKNPIPIRNTQHRHEPLAVNIEYKEKPDT